MRVPHTIVLKTTQVLGILPFFSPVAALPTVFAVKIFMNANYLLFHLHIFIMYHSSPFYSCLLGLPLFLLFSPVLHLSISASHSVWPSIIVLQRVFSRLFRLLSPLLFLPSTQTISTLISSFHLSSTLLLSSFHLHFLNYLNAIFSAHLNTSVSVLSNFLSPSSSSAPVSLLLRSLLPFSLL